ncbi:NAD(P)/FAD-dependent oxidoreductase [Pediococcus ethanolidurans]
MKEIAIIGGGIVGATAAYLLSKDEKNSVTLYDSADGQATKAAAGIISPWLSKRRNKQWYALAKDGATYIAKLAKETHMDSKTYLQSGTIVTRKETAALNELEDLANKRKLTAPEMGTIQRVTAQEIQKRLPLVTADLQGIFISGGARIDGNRFVKHLLRLSEQNGVQIIRKKAELLNNQTIQVEKDTQQFDTIIICVGAGIKELLAPLGYEVHVHPQKGQLIELQVPHYQDDVLAPVLMPESEKDFMPIGDGRLIIGATHENDAGFDLKFTQEAFEDLFESAKKIDNRLSKDDLIATRVGTRAFTDDFSPFFGQLPNDPRILVASGLGSSGLTTGPLIANLMVSLLNTTNDFSNYQKRISTYFS